MITSPVSAVRSERGRALDLYHRVASWYRINMPSTNC